MEECVEWDDSNEKITEIIEKIENNSGMQIPMKCPICNTDNGHIYMHRWENSRGTIWAWCSNCKTCSHGSRLELPKWWKNANFIEVSELTSHPVFLELKAKMIDEYVMQLLRNSY